MGIVGSNTNPLAKYWQVDRYMIPWSPELEKGLSDNIVKQITVSRPYDWKKMGNSFVLSLVKEGGDTFYVLLRANRLSKLIKGSFGNLSEEYARVFLSEEIQKSPNNFYTRTYISFSEYAKFAYIRERTDKVLEHFGTREYFDKGVIVALVVEYYNKEWIFRFVEADVQGF